MITIDDLKKVEIMIGKILSAEKIEGSEKLLKLSIDFAEAAPRQVISGIGRQYPDPAVLAGQSFPFVTNLEPRMIMGLESQAMILAASSEAGSLCSPQPSLLLLEPRYPKFKGKTARYEELLAKRYDNIEVYLDSASKFIYEPY